MRSLQAEAAIRNKGHCAVTSGSWIKFFDNFNIALVCGGVLSLDVPLIGVVLGLQMYLPMRR